jgi:hypothetical protein
VTPPPKARRARAERARRVQRRAGHRADDHDDRDHDAADHDAGEVARRAASTIPRIASMSMNVPMPSAKIAEPQVVVSSLKRGLAHAEVDAGLREERPDRERAEHGADDLRGPVGRHLAPGKRLVGRERERHGGVDVTARDLAEGIHERGDDEAERERDAEQVRACDGRLGVAGEHERRHDRAGSYGTSSAVPSVSASAR